MALETTDKGVETTEKGVNETEDVPTIPPIDAMHCEDDVAVMPLPPLAPPPSNETSVRTSLPKKRKVDKGRKSREVLQADAGSSSDEVLGAKHLTTTKKTVSYVRISYHPRVRVLKTKELSDQEKRRKEESIISVFYSHQKE
mmetsp:Transcript_39458/g.82508  ORF Transcript_39458/g.82508 Transcript_39458/m.82508 type:complete len:142 (+) Transcript_39458:120-545(+)